MTHEDVLALIAQAKREGWTKLDLSDKGLTSLPSEIAQLTNLITLDVYNNQLSVLPPEIAQLTNLTQLYVSDNQLSVLPPEIAQLTNLTTLNVGGNQLSVLPPEIAQLTNLTRLDVYNNQFSVLSPEIAQLTNLTTLDVYNNQLSVLLPELWQLQKLEKLDVRGNLLPVPPEVLNSEGKPSNELTSAQPLLREYADIMRNGSVLNEARLIVVGEARAGKTSLIKQLLGEAFNPNEDSTHGVFIRELSVSSVLGDIRVNVWDFGGQDIYKSTHQFFLSERALYVLVLNAEQNEQQNRVTYWLKLIQSYGRGAPVIVVINKSESYQLNLDERRLRFDFANIAAPFIRTSAKTRAGLASLREQVQQQICRLRHVHTRLYERHVQVKQRLQRSNKSYISHDQFADWCDEAEIKGEERQAWLLRLLNDLGAAVAFDDDPNMAGKYVLDPAWVTRGVYQLLTEGEQRLRVSDARRLLDRQTYPADAPSWLLQLMHKFELCYPLNEQADKAYLLLDKLPNITPPEVADWAERDALRFEYRYAALPSSVITRFMARMHPFLQGEPWLTGTFLRSSDARNLALVYADLGNDAVFLAVDGYEATRRSFLAAICAQFEHIHASVNLQPEAYLPISAQLLDAKERERKLKPKPLAYADLLAAEEAGERDYFVPELRRRLNLRTLLDGVRVEVSPQALYEVLKKHFSKDEIKIMCDDIGLDFEQIYAGDGGKNRAGHEVVNYVKRHDKLDALLRYIRRERPGVI